jgi:hypothetical protein
MPGAGISGKDGDVKIGATQIAEITKWSFNPKANIPKYASNKTGGYKKAVVGVRDGAGSIEGKWDPAIPATSVVAPGTLVTLKLYINATQFWSVPSAIEGFKHDVDLDTGEVVGWSADFQTDGAWTDPVAAFTLPPELEGIPEGAEAVFLPNVPVQTEGQELSPAAAALQKATEESVRAKRGTLTRQDLVKECVEASLAAQQPIIDGMQAMLAKLTALLGQGAVQVKEKIEADQKAVDEGGEAKVA